jgi:hypothetical protein
MFEAPYQRGWDTPVSWHPVGALEAHRHAGSWFAGAALDAGPSRIHPLGAALFAGAEGGLGRARLEASFGLGIEAFLERTNFIDGTTASDRRGLSARYPRCDLPARATMGRGRAIRRPPHRDQ